MWTWGLFRRIHSADEGALATYLLGRCHRRTPFRNKRNPQPGLRDNIVFRGDIYVPIHRDYPKEEKRICGLSIDAKRSFTEASIIKTCCYAYRCPYSVEREEEIWKKLP
jgi:hypothetical protein